jgi:hypothetical protein
MVKNLFACLDGQKGPNGLTKGLNGLSSIWSFLYIFATLLIFKLKIA